MNKHKKKRHKCISCGKKIVELPDAITELFCLVYDLLDELEANDMDNSYWAEKAEELEVIFLDYPNIV